MYFERFERVFYYFALLRKNIEQYYVFRVSTIQWKWKTILEKTCKRCLIMNESHIHKGSLDTFISTIIKHICMSGLVSSECGTVLIVASLTGAKNFCQPWWRWTEMRPMLLIPNTGELGMGGHANICWQNFAQWAKYQVNRFFILDFHPKFTLSGHN